MVYQGALLISQVVALAVGRDPPAPQKGMWRAYSIPLQLYLVVELAVFLFPRGVHFPHRVAIAMITERLTSISAVAGCCLLAVMRPSKWHWRHHSRLRRSSLRLYTKTRRESTESNGRRRDW